MSKFSVYSMIEFYYATLDDGGATYSITGERYTAKKGYAVSLAGGKSYNVTGQLEPTIAFQRSVERVLESIDHMCVSVINTVATRVPHIGSWIGPVDAEGQSIMYIDPVIIVYDRSLALQVASDNGQLAIYDFAAGSTIDVPIAPKRRRHYKRHSKA